uniref:Uncharacterized protein n=1 Tax=Gallus gallus TaxID=9031 RepID=A0A8V0YJG6_CHICK
SGSTLATQDDKAMLTQSVINFSPIDIKTKEVKKKDASLGLFQIFWKSSTCKEIFNVGHSFHVDFEDRSNQSG